MDIVPITHQDRLRVGGALVVLLYAVYSGTGIWMASSGRPLYTLATPLDVVPFTPWASLAYLWLFPQVLAPLVVIQDRRVLRRAAGAYAFLIACGLPFWLVFPVTVPRSPVPVTDLGSWGLALTRFIDPPTNCFPSMHVAESVLAAVLVARHDRLVGRLLYGTAAVVTWSTMALGQHWAADALFGAALALVADHLFFTRRPLPPHATPAAPRWHHLFWVAVYVLLFAGASVPYWAGLLTPADLGAPAGFDGSH
jgi:membrane-associated phospholipid phosphatase